MFRNESLDATHLAEFHQIEGLIADHNLTLGDLIGSLAEFFEKLGWYFHVFLSGFEFRVHLGVKKLRFKPAYNPYTEPSMEVFSYHDGKRGLVV